MSFESSPYLPLRISFSSKTGVSRVVAPWRLKTVVTVSKRRSRRAASSPVPGNVSTPWLGTSSAALKDRAQHTVSCALGHLQVEILGFVVFAHVVINGANCRLDAVCAVGLEDAGWRREASEFTANNCVSRDVLEERGAGKVGWEEPHERESDSTGKDKRVRAKESSTT